jgi:hypothetical protein
MSEYEKLERADDFLIWGVMFHVTPAEAASIEAHFASQPEAELACVMDYEMDWVMQHGRREEVAALARQLHRLKNKMFEKATAWSRSRIPDSY